MPTSGLYVPSGQSNDALTDPIGQYDPVGHVLPVVVSPAFGQKRPAKQMLGALNPVTLQNDPTGQMIHAVVPPGEYNPARKNIDDENIFFIVSYKFLNK